VGSKVVFRLESGAAIANQPKLLVNLPCVREGAVEMTMTQPVEPRETASNKVPPSNSRYKQFEERVRIAQFEGGDLDCSYQESFEPCHSTLAYLEFEVKFDFCGAFYFQLQFYDEEIKAFNFTKAQFVNVEPSLKIKIAGNERQVNLKQISL